jgi:hypothetical protein
MPRYSGNSRSESRRNLKKTSNAQCSNGRYQAPLPRVSRSL